MSDALFSLFTTPRLIVELSVVLRFFRRCLHSGSTTRRHHLGTNYAESIPRWASQCCFITLLAHCCGEKRKAHFDSNMPTFARPWRWCAAAVRRRNVGGHLICVIAFKSTLASSLKEEKYNAWICRQQAFCWSNKIRELLAQHQKWHHLIGKDASSPRAVK